MSLPEYQLVDRVMVRVVVSEGMDDHGKCEYGQMAVFINADDDPQVQVSTLLHELAHIGHSVYGLNGESDEERVVNFVEWFTGNLIRDNDLSWLRGGE